MHGMTFCLFSFDRIADIDKLGVPAFSVLVRMAASMTRGGYVRVTYKQMAKQFPISRSAYYRAVGQLVDADLIERRGDYGFLVKAFRYGEGRRSEPSRQESCLSRVYRGLMDVETGEIKQFKPPRRED